jgi:hypothetical protein
MDLAFMLDPENMKIGAVALVMFIAFLWFLMVTTAFLFFARTASRSGERFRLSLGFSLASIVFPPFCMVPIALNYKE